MERRRMTSKTIGAILPNTDQNRTKLETLREHFARQAKGKVSNAGLFQAALDIAYTSIVVDRIMTGRGWYRSKGASPEKENFAEHHARKIERLEEQEPDWIIPVDEENQELNFE